MKWTAEGNKAFFEVEEGHKFYVIRVENGFEFRVYDEREEKPIILYYNKLTDGQLGL